MSKKTKTLIAIIILLIILLAIIILVAIILRGKPEPVQEAQPTTDLYGAEVIPSASSESPAVQEAQLPTDLYGVWTANGAFLEAGVETRLSLYIVTLEPAPDQLNTYLGTGCMQTEASGGQAPLSLQATYDAEKGSYSLNILSTLISPALNDGAAVIHLIGAVDLGSSGIMDDLLSGTAYISTGEIAWSGEHTTHDIVMCPPGLDSALSFLGEFGLHRDLAYVPPFDVTNFQGETNIVSYQMRVEAADGTSFLAGYNTDIFSPDVNFIDQFRFDTHQAVTPLAAQNYVFTLLNVLGNPIYGVEDQDVFRRCEQGAATNPRAVVHILPDTDQVDYVEVIWDAPEIIPGYFEPQNGNGFYQLTLEYNPWRETARLYGSESLQPTHNIPWNTFEPGAAGFPDGQDYGISLAELEDGQYILLVGVYSYYDPPEGETGFDCRVYDSRHGLFLTKQGNQITVQPAGAISGFVTDEAGNPLANIAVKVDGMNTGFHEGVCSAENGYYLFTRLPLDTYTLSAGGFEAEDCPANSYATLTQPDIVLDVDDPILEGMDIRLSP